MIHGRVHIEIPEAHEVEEYGPMTGVTLVRDEDICGVSVRFGEDTDPDDQSMVHIDEEAVSEIVKVWLKGTAFNENPPVLGRFIRMFTQYGDDWEIVQGRITDLELALARVLEHAADDDKLMYGKADAVTAAMDARNVLKRGIE